jgi:uncharacterized protein (TIGR04141 family)
MVALSQEQLGMAKLPLSIYLLKQDRVSIFEKDLHVKPETVLPLAVPLDGYVIPLPLKQTVPQWAIALNSVLQNPNGLSLLGASPAALMVVRRGPETFVLTFGHAWMKLEDDWKEKDFGRRVALNSIRPDKLVEIEIEQVFARWHVARERAPRASAVDEFGVEFDRDLVASIEGLPSHKILGKKLRGGTSLRVDVDISNLGDLLDKSSQLFKSTAYRKHWPDIDNLSMVTDETLVNKLEVRFDEELKDGTAEKKLVMLTPTNVREEALATDSYVFGRMRKTPAMVPYLFVESWLSYLEREKLEKNISEARGTSVHLLNDENEPFARYSVFQCFGYELSVAGKHYVLSSGNWWEVSQDFLTKVNRGVTNLRPPEIILPPWNQVESEGEYNERCAQVAGFTFYDAQKLWYGGGQSQLEFCDLLHLKSKTLYFAKIPTKSSGMSHLVEQVRRTTELFFSPDNEYRKELKRLTKVLHKDLTVDWLETRPRQGDWNICLVCLGKTAPTLPFFARCGLFTLDRALRTAGHKVSFLKV